MRWITCYVTKEKGNSDEYYYAPDGHYYKTKELYDKRMHDKDVSKEIIQFINQKILCSAHSQMHGILSSQYLKMMEKPTGYYITDTGKEEIIKILKTYDKSEFLLPENNQQ